MLFSYTKLRKGKLGFWSNNHQRKALFISAHEPKSAAYL